MLGNRTKFESQADKRRSTRQMLDAFLASTAQAVHRHCVPGHGQGSRGRPADLPNGPVGKFDPNMREVSIVDFEVRYDRSVRPLELWAAVLSASRGLHAFDENDIEALIGRTMGYLNEMASPTVKAMSLYVIGKSILLLREHYPEWSEWVAWSAILSGEWAQLTGDAVLILRSEALFTEYVQLLRNR